MLAPQPEFALRLARVAYDAVSRCTPPSRWSARTGWVWRQTRRTWQICCRISEKNKTCHVSKKKHTQKTVFRNGAQGRPQILASLFVLLTQDRLTRPSYPWSARSLSDQIFIRHWSDTDQMSEKLIRDWSVYWTSDQCLIIHFRTGYFLVLS